MNRKLICWFQGRVDVARGWLARPQAVYKQTNKKYWDLINEFYKITGVPLLLNTSFNVQEPIVCTPREAVNTFLNTRVDYLVLDQYMARLPSQGS